MELKDVTGILLAAGALGTAAFGIVETLKRLQWPGEAGFGALLQVIGPIVSALRIAYGPDYERLLRAQYRGEQRELARLIRQGARVGLTDVNAADTAAFLGVVDVGRLLEAVRMVQAGKDLPAELRNVVGRFELAVDTRIDAALALARSRYVSSARIAASCMAVLLALFAGFILENVSMARAVIVGVIAVPIAPVAKDLVTALQSASQALRAKS
jgi:hypothetical protein